MRPKRTGRRNGLLLVLLWTLVFATLSGCAEDPPAPPEPGPPPRIYASEGTTVEPVPLATPIPYVLPFNFTDGETSREYSYYKAASVYRSGNGYVSFALVHLESMAFDVYLGGFPPYGTLFCTSRGGKTLFEQCSGYMTGYREDFYLRVEYVGRQRGAEYSIYVGYLNFSG